MKRIVVGISGSSGAVYGARIVEILAHQGAAEVHLVISQGAKATLEYETNYALADLENLAHAVYSNSDLGATLASGTFLTDGMIVAPCSIKTLSAIANSYNSELITRAADVTLKERRTLTLVVRETPLHVGHLRLMTQASEAGAVILPPVPGFYTRPESVSDIVDHTVTKILDQFGIEVGLIERWSGLK